MKLASFIVLGAVCAIMSVLYAIFNDKKGWQGFFVKALTLFCILSFSLVLSHLKAITNATSLFIALSCGVFLLGDGLNAFIEDNKNWIEKLCFTFANAILLAATISVYQTSILALAGGILLGLGLGLIAWTVGNKQNVFNVVLLVLQLALIGGCVGCGIFNVLGSLHFLTAVLVFLGSVLLLAGMFIKGLNKNNKTANIVASLMFALGLSLIASSTYFY